MHPLPSLLTAMILAGGFACTAVVAADDEDEVKELREQVEALRSLLPGQAFAMTQIAYNASNLYFAAQAENWPLAEFYLKETRVRLDWALRLTPVRKVSTGELALEPLAAAVKSNQIAALEKIIADQDKAAFAQGYADLLNACQSCHVAAEKPYLRLTTPAMPAESLINFQP